MQDGQEKSRMARAIKIQVMLAQRLILHRQKLGQVVQGDEFFRKFSVKFREKFNAGRYDRKYEQVQG